MIYLELDDVLAIACELLGLEVDTLVKATDVALADSAVARPRAGFDGQEFYPTVEAKAASLLFGLARNHAFMDGNKRIALLAALQFLNANELDLDLLPIEETYKTVVQVASGNISVEDLTNWIRDRVEPLHYSIAGIILGPTALFSLVSDDMLEGLIIQCTVCGSTEMLIEQDDWNNAVKNLKYQMTEHVSIVHPGYKLRFAKVVDGTGDISLLGACLESGPPGEVIKFPHTYSHCWELSETVWRCTNCGLEAC